MTKYFVIIFLFIAAFDCIGALVNLVSSILLNNALALGGWVSAALGWFVIIALMVYYLLKEHYNAKTN